MCLKSCEGPRTGLGFLRVSGLGFHGVRQDVLAPRVWGIEVGARCPNSRCLGCRNLDPNMSYCLNFLKRDCMRDYEGEYYTAF